MGGQRRAPAAYHHTIPRKEAVSLLQEVGCVSGPSWTPKGKLTLTGDRIWTVQRVIVDAVRSSKREFGRKKCEYSQSQVNMPIFRQGTSLCYSQYTNKLNNCNWRLNLLIGAASFLRS